jgi:Putative esterase
VGLTSGLFIGLAGFLAATAFAGTLLLWRRVASPGPSHVLARVGLLVWAQVTVMLVIFLSVNKSFGFFASWTDLFGTNDTTGVIVAPHRAGGSQAPPISTWTDRDLTTGMADGWPGVAAGQGPSRLGELRLARITGVRSGITATAYIYLPPQYFGGNRGVAPPGQQGVGDRGNSQPAPAAFRFPVIVVISDHVATAADPYSAVSIAATAAAEIDAGRAKPAIYVMTTPAVAGGRDRGCLDVPGGPQAATFFSQDLPAAIQAAYPVSHDQGGWAVMGDASGGYCALSLATAHSDRFAVAAAPLAGYSLPPGATGTRPGSPGWWISGGSPAIREQDDLTWRLRSWPPQPVSLFFTRSAGAGSSPGAARTFVALARSPTRAAEITLATGREPLAPALDRITARLTPGGRP